MLNGGVRLHPKGQIHSSDFKLILKALYKYFYKPLSCIYSIAHKYLPLHFRGNSWGS